MCLARLSDWHIAVPSCVVPLSDENAPPREILSLAGKCLNLHVSHNTPPLLQTQVHAQLAAAGSFQVVSRLLNRLPKGRKGRGIATDRTVARQHAHIIVLREHSAAVDLVVADSGRCDEKEHLTLDPTDVRLDCQQRC